MNEMGVGDLICFDNIGDLLVVFYDNAFVKVVGSAYAHDAGLFKLATAIKGMYSGAMRISSSVPHTTPVYL